jgi:pimeloyl-ACP methyl ester carboxylesterase
MADRLTREGMAAYARDVLPKMIAPGTIAAQPATAAHVLAMMQGTAPAGAAAALRGRAERPDYVPLLGRIRVPTLIVVGSEDEFTPVGDAEFLQRSIAGSELVVIPEAGHMPNLERPADFNRALDTFLRRIG